MLSNAMIWYDLILDNTLPRPNKGGKVGAAYLNFERN